MEEFARVTFHKLEILSQHLRSENEHAVAKVYFDINMYGKHKASWAYIRQDAGESNAFEKEPLNVQIQDGTIRGPFNYEFFREQAEIYYYEVIGKSGKAISVSEDSREVSLSDITFTGNYRRITFKVRDNSPAW